MNIWTTYTDYPERISKKGLIYNTASGPCP